MFYGLKQGVVVFFLALGMVGCAGSVASSKTVSPQLDSKEEVAGLAALRWETLIKGDVAKAYSHLSPGKRSILSLDSYRNQIRTGLWKDAKVDSVSCEQDVCKVVMLVKYDYRQLKSIETRVEEDWLRAEGKWWYSPKN